MHLHDLPWPSDLLESLGELETRLRVTLSYFVEPSQRWPCEAWSSVTCGSEVLRRRP